MEITRINISDLSELQLLSVRSSMLRPVKGRVSLDFPQLDECEALDWASRLEHQLFACGCAEGTFAAIGFLVGEVIWRVSLAPWDGFRWFDIPLTIAAFVLGTALGKALGIWRAKLALITTKNELSKRISSSVHNGGDHANRSLHRVR